MKINCVSLFYGSSTGIAPQTRDLDRDIKTGSGVKLEKYKHSKVNERTKQKKKKWCARNRSISLGEAKKFRENEKLIEKIIKATENRQQFDFDRSKKNKIYKLK